MANKERGEVDFVARGKTWTLVLTTNGGCALEDASGRTVDDILTGALRHRLRDMRWMIWGCLQDRHADEIKTLTDAGALIDDAGGLDLVWKALSGFSEANADTSTDQKAGAGKAADPRIAQGAANGTGSMSMPAASA